jgi:circadian clock protein KaiC
MARKSKKSKKSSAQKALSSLVKKLRTGKQTETIVKVKEKYLKTGIPGFDSLLEKGIPSGKAVLLEGSPGSGKTIFCLQAAYNAAKSGKRTLYMSFEESESSLQGHMQEFGWNPAEMQQKGFLRLKRFSAIDIARSVEALLSEAKKELLIATEPILFPRDFDPEIIFIDSLTSIASAFSGEEYRFRIYMEQLFRYLEEKGISSYLIHESPYPTHIGSMASSKGGAISFLADGIICLYNVLYPGGRRGNALEIIKLRGSNFKKITVQIVIKTKGGMTIYPHKELKGKYILT